MVPWPECLLIHLFSFSCIAASLIFNFSQTDFYEITKYLQPFYSCPLYMSRLSIMRQTIIYTVFLFQVVQGVGVGLLTKRFKDSFLINLSIVLIAVAYILLVSISQGFSFNFNTTLLPNLIFYYFKYHNFDLLKNNFYW